MKEDTSTPPRIQISVPPTNEYDDDTEDEEQEFDSQITATSARSTFSSSAASPAAFGDNANKNESSMLEFPINVECKCFVTPFQELMNLLFIILE